MRPESQSLITQDAIKMVGMETDWGAPFRVEFGITRKFVQAVYGIEGDRANREPIPESAHSKVAVPYSILLCNMPSGSELDFDIPLRTSSRVRGKDEIEIFQPIHIGDVIKAKTRILDISEKEGRSGRMVFILTETEYVNQQQAIVMTSRTTVIKR
ncbi:MaoC family dehydratase N-terminal domain-containing protein [Chloroflexota bacterium]